MKLTVGPLPSAVYWRRRAIVLGGVLIAGALLWGYCSVPSGSDKSQASASQGKRTSSSPTLLTPVVDNSSPTTATTTAPAAAATGPVSCADTDILLTPVAEPASAPAGAYLKLTLKVKNISSRTCVRDLGADAQELYIQQGTVKVWSSDSCDPLHGTSVRTLTPGEEQAFFVQWRGVVTSSGCPGKTPQAGKYQLYARVATKISEPATITLT